MFFPIITFISILFILAGRVYAQNEQICNTALPAILGCDPTGGENIIGRLLARVFSAALAAGAIGFLLYLVFGAFRWLTAGDNKGQVESARSTITQALIGIVLLASIFAIGRIVGTLLGLQCNGLSFPDVICWPEVPAPTP